MANTSSTFCISLHQRREWTAALRALSTSGWKDAKLDAHDIAFPVSLRSETNMFRAILVGSAQETQVTKQRLERLHVLNGGVRIAAILLLNGENAMGAFIKLQMEILGTVDVPIIPINSASDLPSCLGNLKKQCNEQKPDMANSVASTRDLVAHCVNGQPLSERQANMLTDIASGFKDLAENSLVPDSQQLICDLLGDEDGGRLISFFTQGPRPFMG